MAKDFTYWVSQLAPRRRTVAVIAAALVLLNVLGNSSAAAQEQMLFPAVHDAQAVMLQKIRNERVRIDVGIWILGDGELVQTLINKFTIDKVPVRVLGDRAIIFETDPDTRASFEALARAGVPIRLRYNPTWYPEILHWKATIFAGQGLVEFGSANYTGYELKPWSATDFKDESVMFTDDPAIVNAFRTKFDQYWVDTQYFKDWADAYVLETGTTWTAPMTIPRGRQEPDYPTTIPGMIWGQGPELNSAMIAEIDRETRGVDMMFYRLTVPDITDALIRKYQSGVPVRVFAEPTQYRNDKWPEFWLVGAMVDRLIAAGIPVKQRKHAGLTHIKGMITSNVALNASANFAKGWERDHNYFISVNSKPQLYSAYRQRFDAMWSDGVNYGPFQQQPPYPPKHVSPVNGMVDVPTQPRLEWKRAAFATSFDVYLGTSTDTMTRTRVNAQLDENPPETYTFTPVQPLQPSTIYYWRVVSRTFGTDANPSLTAAADEVWSFRTAAGPGGGGGTGPYGGTAVSLPGTIQAENFDTGASGIAYLDATAGNSGGQYRSTDVDLEATADTGGGYNIGWVRAGEWLKYSVNVASAGTYTVEVRLAAPTGGGTFHIEVDGVNRTGSLTVPATGDWQAWTTLTKTGVSLAAGPQVWRLVFDAVGAGGAIANVNYVRVSAGGGGPPPASTPYNGTPVSLPGTVQAENFDNGGAAIAFWDNTSGNTGGQYRQTDVDVTIAQDTGGGYLIGWVDGGEWVNYTVNVTAAGTYDMEFRVASSGTGGTFHVEVAGVNRSGPISIPNTGGWQTWMTVRKTGITLSAGTQIVRLIMDTVGPSGAVANFNWFRVVTAGGAPPASTPFSGTPIGLPGLIELENFDQGGSGVAYSDSSAGNDGGDYRATDVDLKATTDTGGGYLLGWTAPGEWLNYTVNIASAAVYRVEVRVASNGSGGTFHLEVDGVDRTGPLAVPNTSGWQVWTTITKTGVSLPAGVHVVRLVMDAAGSTGAVGNFNWVRISP